jgi:geranylgeranyl pyrophosphate synthase
MLDLDAYLRDRQAEVERRLPTVLPDMAARPVVLGEAMRHAVLVGGKRLRPILCLAAAEAAGGPAAAAWPAALAVELLHAYTLVHDDLPCMDNDLIRRGQPTVHAKFGEAVAVLTGDALQALAFAVAASGPPATAARLVAELAAAAGAAGVVGGQVEDIAWGGRADAATVRYVHQHKTADLFRAAARMGAIAGGGDAAAIARLGEYANELGLAFQIVDDLLDDPAGKPGRPPELSCLHVMDASAARRLAAQHTARATAALTGLPGPAEPLAALVGKLLGRLK